MFYISKYTENKNINEYTDASSRLKPGLQSQRKNMFPTPLPSIVRSDSRIPMIPTPNSNFDSATLINTFASKCFILKEKIN